MRYAMAPLLFMLTILSISCSGDVGAIRVCGDASVALSSGAVDLSNDPANCGCVGLICPQRPHGSAACVDAHCVVRCDVGWDDCDENPANGCEADLTAISSCGRCGSVCVVTNGSPGCAGGACSILQCEAGFADCDRVASNGCEIDLRSLANCAMCGVQCRAANARSSCLGGRCGLAECLAGFGNCDGELFNGCEVEMRSNADHCGRCDNACPRANATAVCTSGACSLRCNEGWDDCQGGIDDGCETNLMVSPINCGGCGVQCASRVANVNASSCRGGVCDYDTCLVGFGECDGNRANGCETNLADVSNCGSCRNDCASNVVNANSVVCNSGRCGYTGGCQVGYADCDSNRSNGCESNLGSINTCGSCTNSCTSRLSNVVEPLCRNGRCDYSRCLSNFNECDGDRTNGCEASQDNVATCGSACTNCARTVANTGSPSCIGRTCNYTGSCAAGYGDCDTNRYNGCERSLTTLTSCGSCSSNCLFGLLNVLSPTCVVSGTSGRCDYIGGCRSGSLDCDANRSNGCELSCPSGSTFACGRYAQACCGSGFPNFCDIPAEASCWASPVECSTVTRCTSGRYAGTRQACHRGTTCNPCP